MALGDGLEEGGLSDVCKADLNESQRKACRRACGRFWWVGEGVKGFLKAHNSTLQAVSRTAQEDLLLLDWLLGRHFLS